MKFLGPPTGDGTDTEASYLLILQAGGVNRLRFDSIGRLDPTILSNITDEFCGGNTTSGNIGELGWATVFSGAGSLTQNAAISGHPGSVNLITGAAGGNNSGIMFGSTGLLLNPADNFDAMFCCRWNTTTNIAMVAGFTDSTSLSLTPTNSITIQKGTGSTTWSGVTRAASSASTTSSSVGTADTGWHTFRIRRVDASTIGFCMDHGTERTLTTTIPTATLHAFFNVSTSEAVAKNMDVDYFDLYTRVTR